MKIGLDFLLGFALDWIGYGLDTIMTSPNFFQIRAYKYFFLLKTFGVHVYPVSKNILGQLIWDSADLGQHRISH